MVKKLFNSNSQAWLLLMAAILCEILGTTFMTGAARDGAWLGYVLMGAALALSYTLLSLALRAISVGVAYAVWEGLGLVGLSLIGIYWLGETPSLQTLAGLALALFGLACVTLGETHEQEACA